MDKAQESSRRILAACQSLMEELNCDFVGVALQNKLGPEIIWKYAAGNTNDKYKLISLRYGKGIAGKVISTGSSVMVENFPNEIPGKPTEYPILLAEKLVSSYAVPICAKGIPKGVLLIGNRIAHRYTAEEQEEVTKCARELEACLIHGELL